MEMNEHLAKYLDQNRYVLKHSEVRAGKAQELIDMGLEIMTVCYAGQGRSPLVAELLNRSDIPAIALSGGIKTLGSELEGSELIKELNKFPKISVILDWAERRDYQSQLAHLNVCHTFDTFEIALRQLAIEK
jgi:hypothetical protein